MEPPPRATSPLSQRVRETEKLAPHRDWLTHAVAHKPPRSVLYKRRVCELAQYREDSKSRKYDHLTRDQKLDIFGSTVVPIPVPLAPGETEEQYEERFKQWLDKQNLTLAELEASSDDHLERFYRIKFANLNSLGKEAFGSQSRKRSRSPDRSRSRSARRQNRPPRENEDRASESSWYSRKSRSRDRSHDRKTRKEDGDSSTYSRRSRLRDRSIERRRNEEVKVPTTRDTRRCKLELPNAGAPITEVVEAYISCGCRPCLVSGMGQMVDKLAWFEKPSEAETVEDRHIDLTEDSDSVKQRPAIGTAEAIKRLVLSEASIAEVQQEIASKITGDEYAEVVEDVVENQLVFEYDAINDRVEQPATPSDFDKSEIGNRNAALAMAIVYLWRHDPNGLQEMISETGAPDEETQQRAIHRRCMVLSSAISHKKTNIAKLKQQIDATLQATTFEQERDRIHVLTRLGRDLSITEAALQAARKQRLIEFAAIARASQPLRDMVRLLLASG